MGDREERVQVKITYYEGEDIAVISLRETGPDTKGEIAGEELHHPETGEAVPGIVLRITNHVLDGSVVQAVGQPWFPSPLRDQHLAGDLLWFIAEVADVPVLIALFVRWQRSDRREAREVDDLTDEQMDEMFDKLDAALVQVFDGLRAEGVI